MAEVTERVPAGRSARSSGEPLVGSATVVVDGVEYDRADFEKVPTTTPHQDRCREAHHALRQVFRSRKTDAFVAADLNVYYDRQQPRLAVAPDVMVAVGVPQRDRNRYRVWEEAGPPSFVLEVLSRSTRRTDLGGDPSQKQAIYAGMGVREYFVLDGDGDMMPPPRLQGFRLVSSVRGRRSYRPIESWTAADCRRIGATLGYRCQTLDLGIALRPNARGVRFYDPASGEFLATDDEDHAGRDRERIRAESERARADREHARAEREAALRSQAEARVAALERRLADR